MKKLGQSNITNLVGIKFKHEERVVVDEPFLSKRVVQSKRQLQHGVAESNHHPKEDITAIQNTISAY